MLLWSLARRRRKSVCTISRRCHFSCSFNSITLLMKLEAFSGHYRTFVFMLFVLLFLVVALIADKRSGYFWKFEQFHERFMIKKLGASCQSIRVESSRKWNVIRRATISSTFILSFARQYKNLSNLSPKTQAKLTSCQLHFDLQSAACLCQTVFSFFYYFTVFLLFFHPSQWNRSCNHNKQINLEDPWIVTIKNALTKVNATERTWPTFIQFVTLKI